MMVTAEQILQLAPDSSSIAAGKKLMALKNWSELGISPDSVWGKCQGSALYQVQVDITNLGTSCSCPSRKFPCKHALGLLFLFAETPSAIPTSQPPEWVAKWVLKRRDREEKKSDKKAVQTDKPVDEKAQLKRAEQRESRVSDGLERLDLWIRDLVRNGLAGLESRPPNFWGDQARRLVDAQAAGLSSQLLALGELPGSSPNWPEQMLSELGRIKLLIHAWQRIEQIHISLQADIRQMIGWNIGPNELDLREDAIEDTWAVVGQTIGEDKQLRVQRSWILGRQTGRWALVVQFAAGSQTFAQSLVMGTEQAGAVIYYPGALPQRAKFVPQGQGLSQINDRLPGVSKIEEFLDEFAAQLSLQPWLKSTCALFRQASIIPSREGWLLRDQSGQGLPLSGRSHWKLMAMTGGAAIDFIAEWDGAKLRPLGFMQEGRYRPL